MGGFDALVGEHLRYSVDVSPQRNLQGRIGVAEAVECDMLSNPRSLYPGV